MPPFAPSAATESPMRSRARHILTHTVTARTTVLFSLPVIGLIAAFVTVFAVGSNRAKRNFAIANLILRGIGFILGIIAWAGFLGVISRLPWGEWWYEYGGSITAMIDAVKAVI